MLLPNLEEYNPIVMVVGTLIVMHSVDAMPERCLVLGCQYEAVYVLGRRPDAFPRCTHKI